MSRQSSQNNNNYGYESDDLYNAETEVDINEDEDEDVDIIIEADDEQQDIDYLYTEDNVIQENSQNLTKKDLFGDISDISDDENMPMSCRSPMAEIKVERVEYLSDLSMFDEKVFETLDQDEKKYLPLNYIVSLNMEWMYIQEACASGFRSVSNLSRVRNSTIRQLANISQYALDNGSAKIPKLNQAFIDYAAQRGI